MANAAVELAKTQATQKVAAAKQLAVKKGWESLLWRKAAVLTTATTLGVMTRKQIPVTVAGFPWKVVVATAAQVVEGIAKGPVQAVAGGMADAVTAIYTHDAIAGGTLIAGDGSDDDDDDDDGEGEGDGDGDDGGDTPDGGEL